MFSLTNEWLSGAMESTAKAKHKFKQRFPGRGDSSRRTGEVKLNRGKLSPT